MKKEIRIFLLLALNSFLPLSCRITSITKTPIFKVDSRMIWANDSYDAFTDLIRFGDYFYCSFREGTGHVPGENGANGTIRIIRSKDGVKWESVGNLEKEGMDLRDPKLSVTPSNQLMVIIGGSTYEGNKLIGRFPQVSFSDLNGVNFTIPKAVEIESKMKSDFDWIWRMTWKDGVGYGIDYVIGAQERKGPTKMYLVETKDGIYYKKVYQFDIDGFPNESTIRFLKDKMYVLIRRELGDKKGILGISTFPYSQWKFNKLDFRLGGPNFLPISGKDLAIGTRIYKEKNGKIDSIWTEVLRTDLKGKVKNRILLPSGGSDTGYPGMYVYKDTLWISYYSKHDTPLASVYLSKIPLSNVLK